MAQRVGVVLRGAAITGRVIRSSDRLRRDGPAPGAGVRVGQAPCRKTTKELLRLADHLDAEFDRNRRQVPVQRRQRQRKPPS